MALSGENLQRFSDMDDVEVAKEDPDVRGWDVVMPDGRDVGDVKDLLVDPTVMKVRALEVELEGKQFDWDDDRRVAIPIDAVEIDEDDDNVVVKQIAFEEFRNYPAYTPGTGYARRGAQRIERDTTARASVPSSERQPPTQGERLTRAEEELAVGRRDVESGEVRVGKHVETEHVSEPVTRQREQVRVERRPVTERAVGDAEIGDREIRVPVHEEQLVVEKRPVVKEELVISKERVAEEQNVEADLRKERFDVQKEGRVLDEDERKRRER